MFDATHQSAKHLIRNRFLNEQSRSRATDVALIEEDPVDDAFDHLVDRCVFEDDVRTLTTEFEGQVLGARCDALLDEATNLRGSSERDLVDAGVFDQRRTSGTVPGDDVDDPAREFRLLEDLRQHQCRERRCFGWLQDAGVPRRQSGSQLPRGHEEGEVPRDDLAGDTERLGVRAVPRVVEFVGPPGVVEKMRRGEWDVDVT